MGDHLRAAFRQSGKAPEGLVGPELPDAVAGVWDSFLALDRGRRGAEPLAYADIEAWSRLTGRRVSAQDLALILELDRLGFEIRTKR